jgi:catechol 2,3-dioxygenase-like lactoylglutathione lyase family enzyme
MLRITKCGGEVGRMLSNAEVHPTLPAIDLERAKKFYEETLGLKVLKEDPSPGMLFGASNGTAVYLYQRGATKADHTVAVFSVKDVEAEVKELKSKGVKFEEYDMPDMGIKTVDGIATMEGYKGAWFKDTEGNILGISNM